MIVTRSLFLKLLGIAGLAGVLPGDSKKNIKVSDKKTAMLARIFGRKIKNRINY